MRLGYSGAIALPQFDVGGVSYPSRARFVFWNRDSTAAYVVVQADAKSGLLNSSAAVAVDPGSAKQVTVAAVVNAASHRPARLAPGQIITITGSGLGPAEGASFAVDSTTNKVGTTLAGTQVFFNGLAAPILYASQSQVNTIVPYEMASQQEVTIQVAYQGILSSETKLPMAETAPAIFTLDGSGGGQAVAINQDGTLCDARNPAARGSYVTLYFTGGGTTTSPGITGGVLGSVVRPLRRTALVTVADQPAQVSFAGAAPGFVEGVNQLNIRLAENTPVGPAQTVILTVGTVGSPASATIAVR